jgi:hypothetical protein
VTKERPITLREVLLRHQPHRDCASASLIDKLAAAPPGTDTWTLDLTEAERRLLGSVLADDPQPPTAQEVNDALEVLLAGRLEAEARRSTLEIAKAELEGDTGAVDDLLWWRGLIKSRTRRLAK